MLNQYIHIFLCFFLDMEENGLVIACVIWFNLCCAEQRQDRKRFGVTEVVKLFIYIYTRNSLLQAME